MAEDGLSSELNTLAVAAPASPPVKQAWADSSVAGATPSPATPAAKPAAAAAPSPWLPFGAWTPGQLAVGSEEEDEEDDEDEEEPHPNTPLHAQPSPPSAAASPTSPVVPSAPSPPKYSAGPWSLTKAARDAFRNFYRHPFKGKPPAEVERLDGTRGPLSAAARDEWFRDYHAAHGVERACAGTST
jgi:hypothetical protein